jgi:hypothetical protein
MKDSVYEKPERMSDQFLKYLMKVLLGDFNAKVRGIRGYMKRVMIMGLE